MPPQSSSSLPASSSSAAANCSTHTGQRSSSVNRVIGWPLRRLSTTHSVRGSAGLKAVDERRADDGRLRAQPGDDTLGLGLGPAVGGDRAGRVGLAVGAMLAVKDDVAGHGHQPRPHRCGGRRHMARPLDDDRLHRLGRAHVVGGVDHGCGAQIGQQAGHGRTVPHVQGHGLAAGQGVGVGDNRWPPPASRLRPGEPDGGRGSRSRR